MQEGRTFTTFTGSTRQWKALADTLWDQGETRLSTTITKALVKQLRKPWYADGSWPIPLRFSGGSPDKIRKALGPQLKKAQP